MPEIKELLGKESLLAIKDYIDTKTGSASPKTEVVDLDTFVACEDTALIQHFGEEASMSADDIIFTYFFTGSKCVTKDTTYETIKGLDITEAKYNAIKDSMILNLTTAAFPVAIEITDGNGNISLRKQSIGVKTEDGSNIEVVYFAGETHQAVAINMLIPGESEESPVAIHAIYYFKNAGGAGTRDYVSFTNADQLSDAELAEAISSTDFNTLLNKAVRITKGWKKTVPLADVYKYYPWDLFAGDDHAYRDNFMWVSVPGRPLTIDYLSPGPFVLLFQIYVSDSLVGVVGGNNDDGVIEILQYEPILNEAAAFSTTSTYAVGSLVTYQGKLYKCTTAVTTAGSWSASKWTQVTVNDAFLPLTGGTDHALTRPVYIAHNDLSFIGTAGGFGFRGQAPAGATVPHLGQFNLSKNFGGDGNQYGFQMSAVDITNNRFNQFRCYQNGIAYQIYNNATGTTTNLFTVDTNGKINSNASNFGLVVPATTSWTANKTIATTDSLTSSSSHTAGDGSIQYVEVASFDNGVLTLTTKYLKLQ